MDYYTEEWTIEKLLGIYNQGKLNLNPKYQRNDIWSTAEKRRLIESIQKGYPLPLFFIHLKDKDNYDMVDGQQRTRAIYGFKNNIFKDFNKLTYSENLSKDKFDNYKLSVTILINVEDENLLSDFYYRVNKFGIKLNRAEILKAQYFANDFQELVSNLSDSEEFLSLNIFSGSTLNRMINMDLVGEMLAIFKFGISEKKKGVDELYNTILSQDDLKQLEISFLNVLEIILKFNDIFEISKTRYKQRSDFYTLWSFIYYNLDLKIDVLEYFYKILVLIGEDIYPNNDKCPPFSNYAYNCVTQSNSKAARNSRLKFYNELFLNKESDPNETQSEVLHYYRLRSSDVIKIDDFTNINGKLLQRNVVLPYLFIE